MVTSGTHVNGGCCFDYGNSETDQEGRRGRRHGRHQLQHLCWFGGCTGSGPWVQADLEWGLYPGGSQSVEPQPAGLHQQVRHRDAEEQRDIPLRAQGRQRAVRQPDDPLGRLAAARLQPDEEAGRHRAGQRRRLLQARWRREPERRDLLRGRDGGRLPVRRDGERGAGQHRRRRVRQRRQLGLDAVRCTRSAPASAWTSTASAPPPAPSCRSGTATAGRTRRGPGPRAGS